MKESFDEWFDRLYTWYKKNKYKPHIDKHSEKISYNKTRVDTHIVRHEPAKEHHIIEHGHDHHKAEEFDTLPITEEKTIQEWLDKTHKLWEEHS